MWNFLFFFTKKYVQKLKKNGHDFRVRARNYSVEIARELKNDGNSGRCFEEEV